MSKQVHQYVNNLSRKDQVMPVQFPDVSPTKAKPKGGFNMVAGDFLQVNHIIRSRACCCGRFVFHTIFYFSRIFHRFIPPRIIGIALRKYKKHLFINLIHILLLIIVFNSTFQNVFLHRLCK